jgi:hypothetical protein
MLKAKLTGKKDLFCGVKELIFLALSSPSHHYKHHCQKYEHNGGKIRTINLLINYGDFGGWTFSGWGRPAFFILQFSDIKMTFCSF